jgi:SSS family solute:Na+ symporter
MSNLTVIVAVNLAYLVAILAVGWAAWRRTDAAAEDYLLAGRSVKALVLFMALFGTNITPFVLMGIPGMAYHDGLAVFGLNAAIVVLGLPLTFRFIGLPAWAAARRIGALTPAELFARRLGSPAVGHVLFAAFFVYTLPYIVTAVLGVARAVEVFTAGAVPFAVGSGLVLAVTLAYTAVGGMRATMWTNVLQGFTFMAFLLAAFLVIGHDLGGVGSAMERVAREAPQLLEPGNRPSFATGAWGSWALAISFTVIAFPHMLVRIFSARDAGTLRDVCRVYPLAMFLLWTPVVVLGVWGAVEHPGLVGRASDGIFPILVREHLGPVLQGLALASILAAAMSTLDAQLLTLSSMLVRDVLRHWTPLAGAAALTGRGTLQEDVRREVRWTRGFLVLVTAAAWGGAQVVPTSIFGLASYAFSGYVMLVPTLFLALHWRRFTAAGAIASIVAGNLALVLAFAAPSPVLGLLPVAWGLAAAVLAAVGVSFASRPPSPAVIEQVLGRVSAA